MHTTTVTPSAVSHPLAIVGNVRLESLTISRAAMPHHFLANAKIDDLEPSQMVAAIVAVEDAIRATYPRMQRSGLVRHLGRPPRSFPRLDAITTREWVEGGSH